MNHSKLYDQLISKAQSEVRTKGGNTYYESHHILPRSMGGSNEPSNLVLLTAREHFIAHWLLYKVHRNQSMACAWNVMCSDNKGYRHTNSAAFKYAREAHSNAMKGNTNAKGLVHTEEAKAKMSEQRKGHKHNLGRYPSAETREKNRIAMLGNTHTLGFKHSEESKELMSKSRLGNTYVLGHKQTEEHKANSRAGIMKFYAENDSKLLGRKASDEVRAKMSKARNKFTYTISQPNGETILVNNIPQFCKKNNLSASPLMGTSPWSTAKRTYSQHKGYSILSREPIAQQ